MSPPPLPHTALKFPDHWKVFAGLDGKPHAIPLPVSVGEKTRILVAEDNPVCRHSLVHYLTQAGYEVVVTENGTDAITELRKSDHPPIAILDWMMPGMDGIEICERMRDANKVVYLILSSGKDSTQEIVAGLEAGADDYLPKPIVREELLAHIKVGLRIIGLQKALALKVDEMAGRMTRPSDAVGGLV